MPPSLAGALYRDASLPVETRIEDLLSRMTLREKIGQMALVEKNSIVSMTHVSKYGLGALLSGAGGKPEDNTPSGWRTMITGFVDESLRSRTGIPIFYGVDANHGHGNVPGATIFPHAIGLGATGDPVLVEKISRATALEMRATGSQWNFFPSLDLPTDIRWGRVYEAFSSDPVLTGKLGASAVFGLEGDGKGGVLATPKHFLGAGSMQWKTSSNKNFSIDQGVTIADETLLEEAYLPPFREAVESGASSVMLGLSTWGDTKISASKHLVTDVLKGTLGFKGFVVSDWYGVYEISDNKYDATVTALNAGVDMVMLPFEYQMFVRDVEYAVKVGDIPKERIDDAVRRILRVKFDMGLFEENPPPPLAVVGSPEHRALAREAVTRSLVVLKNENNLLPISKDVRKIRIAGSAADNIGIQAGAWTYEWQGIDGNWLPGATSILSGIKAQVGDATVVQYEQNGMFPEKDIADIGIAIVGEKPYAEGWGDAAAPSLSPEDREAIERLRASTYKVIVVIVSGRPLLITSDIPKWDALVAAWLPGSEGGGVADALFGSPIPTGTLPLAWPRTIEQVPIDTKGKTADGTPPLFPRGAGLKQ